MHSLFLNHNSNSSSNSTGTITILVVNIYIIINHRAGCFFTFWGISTLLPVYYYGGGGSSYWNTFTLANIPNDTLNSEKLWVPVVFAYIFSAYFCYLLYEEYRNFVEKRLLYFIEGDPDTPAQGNLLFVVM